jgi:YVTN family beta-propeller protein
MAARPAKCITYLSFLILFPLMQTALPATGQQFVPVNVPGATTTEVLGMDPTNAQLLVGFYVDTSGATHGYLLNGGSVTTLDYPGGIVTNAFDVNDSHQVVGTYVDSEEVDHGFLWSNGAFTALNVPGAESTDAYGINNAGAIVGTYVDTEGVGHGFILIGGGFSTIDVPAATYTEVDGINNLGHIDGTFTDDEGTDHIFLLTSSGFTTLDTPSSYYIDAWLLNDADEVVGEFIPTAEAPEQGFTYSGGIFAAVDYPGASSTALTSVSNSGVLAGSYSTEEARGGFISTNGPFAYAPVRSANSVAVFDVSTTLPVATVQVGSGPVGIGLGPNGNVAYVANYEGNSVSVINTTNNTVIATIPVGISPLGVAVTPDGLFAYVANNFSSNVSVISTVSNTVVATVPVGTIPSFVAITPDGKFAYVTNQTSSNVSVISTASNKVVATVTVESHPVGLAITPNGQFVYVTLAGTNSVAVIRTASNAVVDTIPVGAAPVRISITPDGTTAYVSNQNSGDVVSVISLATNTVISNVLVGSTPYGSAATPDGAYDWVIDAGSGQISVISSATNTVVATLPLSGGSDIAIAAAPPTSQPITQSLSPTLPNVFNFGTNNFTVQYPPGSSFSGVDMTVKEVEMTQAQFQQRVAGTPFANATCIVYAGAGGNCVDDQVTCSESGSPVSCPSEPTPTIAVQTNFSTSQAIVNPGYLTTSIGENSWTNIFVSYSDPTVRAKTTGFSEFVAVDLGTTNSEGAGSLTLLAPLRATDPRVFGAGAGIPVTFELTSIANPNKSVTDAVANLTIVMVSNASGMPESTVVLALNNAFVYESGIGYNYQVNTSAYQAGQYVLTIYGNAFAAQQVTFTIKKRVATTCVINSSSNQFSAGQSTTFTATAKVPPSSGTPTGTITFVDSANSDFVLGTAPLVGGTASIKAVLQAPPPRQWIGAVYSGDNNFESCKSPYIPEDYGNN